MQDNKPGWQEELKKLEMFLSTDLVDHSSIHLYKFISGRNYSVVKEFITQVEQNAKREILEAVLKPEETIIDDCGDEIEMPPSHHLVSLRCRNKLQQLTKDK